MSVRVSLLMLAVSVLLMAGVALMEFLSVEEKTPAAQDTSAEPAAAVEETTAKPGRFNVGEKLDLKDEPRQERASGPPEPAPPEGSAPMRRGIEPLPVSDADWPLPTVEELAQIREEPRYFDPDPGAVMFLTIEALGLYGVPVFDSYSEEVLNWGAMHVPDTAYPWDDADEKNVFIAGHRTGLPQTDGRLLFFELDNLVAGDTIYLEDRGGNAYRYRVTELFRVGPYDGWVADTLAGRDLLTLQTCTYPTFEERLILRADRG